MTKKLTLEDLSKYDGLNGKPSYIGYKGKVYDVTKVFKDGEHAGVKAGTDITKIFGNGPHKEDIFNASPVIGQLVEKNTKYDFLKASSGQADLILRIALGSIFFAHGAQKLLGWFGGYGWDGTMGFLTQTVGLPSLLAALVILFEFFGGIAIIAGFLTRPTALALAAVMLGAIVKVHGPNGFFLGDKNGIEYTFTLLMISIYFIVRGAGKISLDKYIFGVKE